MATWTETFTAQHSIHMMTAWIEHCTVFHTHDDCMNWNIHLHSIPYTLEHDHTHEHELEHCTVFHTHDDYMNWNTAQYSIHMMTAWIGTLHSIPYTWWLHELNTAQYSIHMMTTWIGTLHSIPYTWWLHELEHCTVFHTHDDYMNWNIHCTAFHTHDDYMNWNTAQHSIYMMDVRVETLHSTTHTHGSCMNWNIIYHYIYAW